jgi:hypothetical protein
VAIPPSDRRKDYEFKVRSLATLAVKLRARGWTEQRVARALVDRRNRLKRRAREFDDPIAVSLMRMRNLAKYDNPIGPDADALYRKYRSWAAVVEAACRPARLSDSL